MEAGEMVNDVMCCLHSKKLSHFVSDELTRNDQAAESCTYIGIRSLK